MRLVPSKAKAAGEEIRSVTGISRSDSLGPTWVNSCDPRPRNPLGEEAASVFGTGLKWQ